ATACRQCRVSTSPSSPPSSGHQGSSAISFSGSKGRPGAPRVNTQPGSNSATDGAGVWGAQSGSPAGSPASGGEFNRQRTEAARNGRPSSRSTWRRRSDGERMRPGSERTDQGSFPSATNERSEAEDAKSPRSLGLPVPPRIPADGRKGRHAHAI